MIRVNISAPMQASIQEEGRNMNENGMSILIAEDDYDIAISYKLALEERGNHDINRQW